MMKFPCTFMVIALAIATTQISAKSSHSSYLPESISGEGSSASEAKIKQRVLELTLPVQTRYNGQVRELIRRYISLGSKEAQAMLGRTTLYFPMFEHYLSLHGLPEELKYLPMIESTLRPEVSSPMGAAGLWQVIPSTGRRFGLEVGGYVDERRDPYRGTEAAVKILAYLHNEFGDWALAMAAYNCGSARVHSAIRRANCDDYWEISKFLPRATQKYVPAFIAAAYLVNHYQHHDLKPKFPSSLMQDTRTFRVYNHLTFSEIAKACGISMAVVQKLNPGFSLHAVPKSTKGHFVILPADASYAFKKLLTRKTGKVSLVDNTIPEGMFRTSYIAVPGDRIEALAMLFKCTIEEIMAWNHLRHREIVVGQELTLLLPKATRKV